MIIKDLINFEHNNIKHSSFEQCASDQTEYLNKDRRVYNINV